MLLKTYNDLVERVKNLQQALDDEIVTVDVLQKETIQLQEQNRKLQEELDAWRAEGMI